VTASVTTPSIPGSNYYPNSLALTALMVCDEGRSTGSIQRTTFSLPSMYTFVLKSNVLYLPTVLRYGITIRYRLLRSLALVSRVSTSKNLRVFEFPRPACTPVGTPNIPGKFTGTENAKFAPHEGLAGSLRSFPHAFCPDTRGSKRAP
jgi:hypothetical protein